MSLIDRLLAGPRWLKYEILSGYSRRSYAQEGEDLVLTRIFDFEKNLPHFYVDVGANHPKRFSNTYAFYCQGWKGIAIEPDPDLVKRFARRRPRDAIVAVGIGETEGELTYHRFSDAAMNTFDPMLAKEREASARWKLLESRIVPIRTLSSVLGMHLPDGQGIGFMSVDVEGFDLAVLRSNDWQRFRPRFVLAESLKGRLASIEECEIHALMYDVGYEIVGKAHLTCFYRDAA